MAIISSRTPEGQPGRFRAGGLDSLDRVELLMELEEVVELAIPDKVAEKFRTLDDFLDWWLRGRGDQAEM